MQRYKSCSQNEGLLGFADKRRKFNECLTDSYSCIGFIKANFRKTQCLATGFMINKQFVLTAAHNILLKDQNSQKIQIAQEIYFYPSLNGQLDMTDQSSNAPIKIVDKIFSENYIENYQKGESRHSFDIVLLRLQKPVILKSYLPLIQSFKIEEIKQFNISIIGYPGQKISQGKHQGIAIVEPYIGSGIIKQIQNGIVKHNIDTTCGQSGSPIIVEISKENIYAMGMHIYYSKEQNINYGVVFNKGKIIQIVQWMKKMMMKDMLNVVQLSSFQILEVNIDNFNPQDQKNQIKEHTSSDQLTVQQNLILSDRKYLFDFNWDIYSTTITNNLQIKGKTIKKMKKQSKESKLSLLFSYQYIQICQQKVIKYKIKELSNKIWIGLVDQWQKSIIKSDTNEKYINKQCIIGYETSLKENQCNIYPKQKFSIPAYYQKEFLAKKGESIQIIIDYKCSLIKLYKNKVFLFQMSIDQQLRTKKIFLLIGLGDEGDQIQINYL